MFALPLILHALAFTPTPPALTVVISIDQFRADYLLRFQDLYRPATSAKGVGGFNYLMERGANYINAAYTHVPTETGPGHAVIGTGGSPATTGIVGNDWYSRETGQRMYCVADSNAKDIFTGKPSYSPRNLLCTTMADELETVTGGASKTVSLAIKDRAAILMGGRKCDEVIWFEGGQLGWSTSTAYSKTNQLPNWAVDMNRKNMPKGDFGKTWDKSLPARGYARAHEGQFNAAPASFGKTFPHRLPSDQAGFYDLWKTTPFANSFIEQSAEAAIKADNLGKDGVPDLLTLGLSCNDYTGHMFGPDSPEVLDMAVQTDALISDFLRFLDREVGLSKVLIVVTADHGVMQIPEEMELLGLNGGRVTQEAFIKRLSDRAAADFGSTKLISSSAEGFVYLNLTECKAANADPVAVRKALKEAALTFPEVDTVVTRDEILSGATPVGIGAVAAYRSFNMMRSPDLYVFPRQNVLISSFSGASHGSPYPYDTRVPLLLCGPGVMEGTFADKSGPQDIAATVCTLLRAPFPSGCVGRVLKVK